MSLAACATVNKPTVSTEAMSNPSVSPAIEAQQQEKYQGLKRKVAIARFTNETRQAQSVFLDANQDRVGKQAQDILANKLMETDKFILLERIELGKIQKELSIGNVSPLKNMADYLIVGSVTEFGRTETGSVGLFSRSKMQTANAGVVIRLIDVRTGQIIYSEEGRGEAFSESGQVLGMGSRVGYDSSINDKALTAAITNLASNIIENLMNKPWQSYVLAYEDGYYIISGGAAQGIKGGDVFSIEVEGKKVNNPQTNTMITLPSTQIATLRVLHSVGSTPEDEVSFCHLESGSLNGVDLSKLIVTE
ncbi:MAG: CsgG/HfaB family protein [Pseudomonadota bacterium]